MSWRCSTWYWALGPLDLHRFQHALDDRQPPHQWWFVGWGRRTWQIWPRRPRYKEWEATVLRPRA